MDDDLVATFVQLVKVGPAYKDDGEGYLDGSRSAHGVWYAMAGVCLVMCFATYVAVFPKVLERAMR